MTDKINISDEELHSDQDDILNNDFDADVEIGTTVPISSTVRKYIDTVIQNKLTSVSSTQNILVNESASHSIEIDALRNEQKKITRTFFENAQLKKQVESMKKLMLFKKLEADWNGKGSDAISDSLIERAIRFITDTNLRFQPSVFPTGRSSIQFEFEKLNGNYFEIEMFEDHFSLYSEIGGIQTEKDDISIQEIFWEIDAFHSRF